MRRAIALAFVFLAGAAPQTRPAPRPTSAPSTQPAIYVMQRSADGKGPLILYLPGISSLLRFDRDGMRAIGKAMPTAEVKLYTWPAYNPGMPALLNYERNRAEAKKVTAILHREISGHPGRATYVLCHSGGTGIAAWALEALPAEDKVDQVVMFAPALSPNFDLSGAMRHVRGKIHAVTSPCDPVLGTMTRTFGTIDRQYTDSAGLNGFVVPKDADAAAYGEKLDAMPFKAEWAKLGHSGDHIGPLAPRFVETVIAPLLVPGN